MPHLAQLIDQHLVVVRTYSLMRALNVSLSLPDAFQLAQQLQAPPSFAAADSRRFTNDLTRTLEYLEGLGLGSAPTPAEVKQVLSDGPKAALKRLLDLYDGEDRLAKLLSSLVAGRAAGGDRRHLLVTDGAAEASQDPGAADLKQTMSGVSLALSLSGAGGLGSGEMDAADAARRLLQKKRDKPPRKNKPGRKGRRPSPPPPSPVPARNFTLVTDLPRGFLAVAPEKLPWVRIPTVWHVIGYKDTNGTGPAGYSQALAAEGAARLVAQANWRLAAAHVALSVGEVRADPSKHAYLLYDSKDEYMTCAAEGPFSQTACGSIIESTAVDFPRSINIYVFGESPPTAYQTYSWIPGDAVDPLYGHIGLTWTALSPDSLNSPASLESGALSFVYSVAQFLGLPPLDMRQDCVDEDLAFAGVQDTPVASMPLWSSKWAQEGYIHCMSAQSRFTSSASPRTTLFAYLSALRLGAPAASTAGLAVDTCPSQPGLDDYSNFLSNTYDTCKLVWGHMTPGQVAGLHRMAAAKNVVLYVWGQYYAAVANSSATLAPAPEAPSPPAGGCAQPTEGGCPCQAAWRLGGKTYFGCARVEGLERPVCAMERGATAAGNPDLGACGTLRNGWWDFCEAS
ncbi:hypothetical protein HYH03_009934 [Edaphochlamys debaryana]|uniref:Uncharacterized protein n=1 Tax=Edaphochlamys debaryana TaxID=47281 RepID=A0A836BY04_9CHLO|nr:hypothetical protein HYH03_009934 [Edaphochlamys debaryana]|eukprot:KAG2491773.1 hypothetical protein HYH03_009934 [Edaphochlamys debaryana]